MSDYELDESAALYPFQIDFIQKVLRAAIPLEDDLNYATKIELYLTEGEIYGVVYTGDEARFVPVKPVNPS